MQESTQEGPLMGLHSKGRLLVLASHIKLGRKQLKVSKH
jgi:hypothetical protein